MKIAGCIILYNPTDDIFNNINTYVENIEKLYVFDNSNNTDIYNLFEQKEYFKKVEYITENKNTGIAHALNVCCDMAIKDGFSHILTMDQDSYFTKNSVNNMKKLISDNVAIVAPNYNINGFYTSDELVVMTSGNLLNLDAYQKLNGFMEELFIDMVDYDFCLKARLNKYNIVTSEKALLMHELGNIKSKKIFNKEIKYTNHSPIRRYYITRNRRILHFMYKQYFNEFLKKELTYSKKEMIKVILFEKQKIEKIKMYFKAIVDYNKWKKKYNKK